MQRQSTKWDAIAARAHNPAPPRRGLIYYVCWAVTLAVFWASIMSLVAG